MKWDGKNINRISERSNVFWFLRIRSLLRVLLIRMRANATRQHQRKNADTINSLLFSTLCFGLLLLRSFFYIFFHHIWKFSLSFINFFLVVKNIFFFTTMSLSKKERDPMKKKSHIRDLILTSHLRTYTMWEALILGVSARWMDEKCRRGKNHWRQKMQRDCGLCWVNGISFGKKFITHFFFFANRCEREKKFLIIRSFGKFLSFFYYTDCYFAHT